jgi:hypothetical protein
MLRQSSLELLWERTTTWWNNLLVPKWVEGKVQPLPASAEGLQMPAASKKSAPAQHDETKGGLGK